MARLSEYKAEYADIALGILCEGKSRNGVCATIGICKDTLQTWYKNYPDFKLAIDIGSVVSEFHWEELGAKALRDKEFNTGMYMIQMRNRFKWKAVDPKEPAETDITTAAQVMAMALQMVNDKQTEVEKMKSGA